MSYDTSRLRGVHPPACTCVQCNERRTRGRRGNRGRGNHGGNGQRRGCLPFLLITAAAIAITALTALA